MQCRLFWITESQVLVLSELLPKNVSELMFNGIYIISPFWQLTKPAIVKTD